MTHKNEIIQSRTGGFGGSDAAMFYKIGEKGIESLNDTDKRRIAVAMGYIPYIPIPTTPAMQAGNEFEAWLGENHFSEWESNQRITDSIIQPKNFNIFAHPDFLTPFTAEKRSFAIVEAKYTSADVNTTLRNYMPQLQWYYLFDSISQIRLVKGTQGEPFDKWEERFIAYDKHYFKKLYDGIKLVDKFCNTFEYEAPEIWTGGDLLPHELDIANNIAEKSRIIKELQAEVEILKEELYGIMEKSEVKSLVSDTYSLTAVPPSIRKSFDKKKLFEDHPEISEEKYTKLSETKGYLRVSEKSAKK